VTTSAPPFAGLPHSQLPVRLSALSSLVEIASARGGPGGFSPELLAEAEGLLERAGERLRLSAAHTVVTLAGGTGSGKSSLFNALAGASFSPAAVTRPATRHAHACVWGMQGAAPLLDWLGVERRHRYARASALDAGEASLSGLLLLDLPDHDSVAAGATSAVDRLISLADLMVWVVDPQKYADAAVHSRFLAPLARHATVTTVVLNQCDLLTPEQAHDCEEDLRRLLDSEGLGEARLLLASAVTGAGLDDLRQILADAVSARQTATERIAADIDTLVAKFGSYAREPAVVAGRAGTSALAGASMPAGVPLPAGAPPAATAGGSENGASAGEAAGSAAAGADAPAAGGHPPWEDTASTSAGGTGQARTAMESHLAGPALDLADAFARAAGLAAVADALEDVREMRAAKYLSWPVARLAGWFLRRNAVHAMHLGGVSGDVGAAVAAGADAQQSEIDSAITAFANAVGGTLPDPWPRTVRGAARSRAAEIRGGLSAAISESMPAQGKVPGWWRLVWAWQRLLVALVIAGIGWMGVIVAVGVFHAMGHRPPALLGSVALIPWLGAMVVAMLLLGWLTASGSQNVVLLSADREREGIAAVTRARIAAVARDLVVIPAGSELAEYARFCAELTMAGGELPCWPGGTTPRNPPPPAAVPADTVLARGGDPPEPPATRCGSRRHTGRSPGRRPGLAGPVTVACL
jgi:GTP-binding protein EngB required for normal cell division